MRRLLMASSAACSSASICWVAGLTAQASHARVMGVGVMPLMPSAVASVSAAARYRVRIALLLVRDGCAGIPVTVIIGRCPDPLKRAHGKEPLGRMPQGDDRADLGEKVGRSGLLWVAPGMTRHLWLPYGAPNRLSSRWAS